MSPQPERPSLENCVVYRMELDRVPIIFYIILQNVLCTVCWKIDMFSCTGPLSLMGFHLIEKCVKRSWVNFDFWPGHITCGLCRAIKTKSWLNITCGFIPKRDTMAHIQLPKTFLKVTCFFGWKILSRRPLQLRYSVIMIMMHRFTAKRYIPCYRHCTTQR